MYPLNLDNTLEDLREADSLPDGPITNKKNRQRIAFNWVQRKGVPIEEVSERLGVSVDRVEKYVYSLDEEVLQAMVHTRAEARALASQELQEQLQEVGRKKRTSETDVMVYTDEDGNLVKEEIEDENGQKHILKVPQDIEMQPDEEARFYARQEIREILSMLLDLTGGWEPIEVEKETTVSLDDDIDMDQLA